MMLLIVYMYLVSRCNERTSWVSGGKRNQYDLHVTDHASCIENAKLAAVKNNLPADLK